MNVAVTLVRMKASVWTTSTGSSVTVLMATMERDVNMVTAPVLL